MNARLTPERAYVVSTVINVFFLVYDLLLFGWHVARANWIASVVFSLSAVTIAAVLWAAAQRARYDAVREERMQVDMQTAQQTLTLLRRQEALMAAHRGGVSVGVGVGERHH